MDEKTEQRTYASTPERKASLQGGSASLKTMPWPKANNSLQPAPWQNAEGTTAFRQRVEDNPFHLEIKSPPAVRSLPAASASYRGKNELCFLRHGSSGPEPR